MSADEVIVTYLATGRIDEDQWAALTDAERARFTAERPELDRWRDQLADGDTWVEPPDELEAAILASILSDPTPSVAPLTAPRATGTTGAVAATSVVALADARARRSRAVAIGAGLVAAAAVVVAIVGFASRPSTLDVPTAAGVVSATLTTTTTAVAGDDRSFVLTSAESAAKPEGTVTLHPTASGVQVRLDARQLPRRDKGQFYEAWGRTAQGLVSLGTFHSGDAVVLWSGVDIDELRAITVTLEEDDGNLASSGRRVLLATIVPDATPPGSTAPGTTPGTAAAPAGNQPFSTSPPSRTPLGTTPGTAPTTTR